MQVPLIMSEDDSTQFTLIGLGDIVLPGLLLCFAMRFDDSKVSLLLKPASPFSVFKKELKICCDSVVYRESTSNRDISCIP